MTTKKQLRLSETSIGRIKLHLICLLKDHHFKWHVKGILREIKA